jgi:hypothetical protein
VGIEREMRFWVVLPHVFGIEKTPKPRDLRGQMDHDDLHLNFEPQLQDLLASFQRRLSRRDEHVARYPEPFQLVDHLAELCAPSENAQLGSTLARKKGGMDGYMHLSVLFVAPKQYIRRRLESKVTYVIPVDDSGRWDVGFALRCLDSRLHMCVSITLGRRKKWLTSGRAGGSLNHS